MEPDLKRPRLTLYGHSSDEELERARALNDLSLKSRFEQIFEKYSQDFTGLADEIDLQGAIKVNNGHVKKMKHETDIGVVTQKESSCDGTTGRSILRAMTVDPQGGAAQLERFLPDEALPSIENTTRHMTDASDEDSAAQSEDDLFGSTRRPFKDDWRDSVDTSLDQEGAEAFDEEAVLDGHDRLPSPDFLLQENIHVPQAVPRSATRLSSQMPIARPFPAGHLIHDTSDEAIIQHFGPAVGKEVLDFIGKRTEARQAHIEPAWRIPVDVHEVKGISTPPIVERNPPDPCSESPASTVSVRRRTESPDHLPPAHDTSALAFPSQDDDSDDPLQDLPATRSRPARTVQTVAPSRRSGATSTIAPVSTGEKPLESPGVEPAAAQPVKRGRGRPRKVAQPQPANSDSINPVITKGAAGSASARSMSAAEAHLGDVQAIKIEEPGS